MDSGQDRENLKIFGDPDTDTLRQMSRCLDSGGEKGVLCADSHKGYAHPIGGVVAYRDRISLSGVGYDIACGNMACMTDAPAAEVRKNIEKIMDDIHHRISFGIGRKNPDRVDHPLFDDPAWKMPVLAPLKDMAREQLGTVGSGNHYVDVFVDGRDRVWIGVHFGSRGLGHRTATWFLKKVGAPGGMDVPPAMVEIGSRLADDYLAAMELAGRYAYAGREYACRMVVKEILGAGILDEVHNHHNFAWKERHGEETLWVVRKGATPAFPGQKGFVGGSMGDNAVILEGIDSPASRDALYSTVHGAGRVMSRTAAAGKVKWKRGRPVRIGRGRISRRDMESWVRRKGVCLRGGGCDEAPQAYRRLPDVLKEHEGTVRIIEELRPIGVAMAGEDVNDPYKD